MSCGALASTKIVPELQYWINNIVVNSQVNKYQIPFSPTLNELYLPQKSFIEMLFNENYSYNSYRYLYREVTSSYEWPIPILERSKIYSQSAQYYLCDSDNTSVCSINLFILKTDDLKMLNALLTYRMDSTSVSVIDSTSNEIIGNIIYVNYDKLSTNLSKLICIYLKFKVNNDYSMYNNTSLISSSLSSILEIAFESYLIDQMFQYMSDQGIRGI